MKEKYNIAVAGTGYVGLSIATLLAQHNNVTAVDVIPDNIGQERELFRIYSLCDRTRRIVRIDIVAVI